MKLTPINLAPPLAITDPPQGLTARKTNGMGLTFKNTADGAAELLVYDSVGSGDGAKPNEVARLLRENPNRPITVKINSPGGFAWDGITIFNQLLAHSGPVTGLVEGIAGSAASIIAMACNPLRMYANATLFIHRSAATVIGNEEALAEALVWLRQLDLQLAATYAARTGRPNDEMLKMMVGKYDGTSMTAAKAKALGFADEVLAMTTPNKSGARPAKTAARMAPVFSDAALGSRSRRRRNALCGIR